MAALTTPTVRVSYPQVFEPRAFQGGTPQYSIVMMFDKSNEAHKRFLQQLKAECEKVLVEAWPDPATRPRIPVFGHDKSPMKDADKNCNQQGIPLAEKNPEYAGHVIVRAASMDPVVMVDGAVRPLTDKNSIQGGYWCNVSINPYARKRKDNPGISIGLNGVQLVRSDATFGGGRPAVSDMFGVTEADDPANYNDAAPVAADDWL